MTVLYVPTRWHRNAMTTDMVEIMTSSHPRIRVFIILIYTVTEMVFTAQIRSASDKYAE